jgi:hypothetical protein
VCVQEPCVYLLSAGLRRDQEQEVNPLVKGGCEVRTFFRVKGGRVFCSVSAERNNFSREGRRYFCSRRAGVGAFLREDGSEPFLRIVGGVILFKEDGRWEAFCSKSLGVNRLVNGGWEVKDLFKESISDLSVAGGGGHIVQGG